MNKRVYFVLSLSFAVVVILWLGLLIFVISTSDSSRIEIYGQVGDVFGAINALFTGLALIGLVYTVVLERVQIQTQIEESSKQDRERFLTARLTARAAQVQIRSALLGAPLPQADVRRIDDRNDSILALKRLHTHIELLLFEADLGFGGGAWSPALQLESIRRYVVGLLRSLSTQHELSPTLYDAEYLSSVTSSHLEHLKLVAQVFANRYPGIREPIEQAIRKADLHEGDHDLAEFISWCKSAEDHFPRGKPPWILSDAAESASTTSLVDADAAS